MLNCNKSKYFLRFVFNTVFNFPIKVVMYFSGWLTQNELKEAITKSHPNPSFVFLRVSTHTCRILCYPSIGLTIYKGKRGKNSYPQRRENIQKGL